MNDTKAERWIAALDRARAELEAALSADLDWCALREAVVVGAEHERALAGNPVYRCWEQLHAAIAALRREVQGGPAGPAPGRRRNSLRDVLEHIRSDPAVQETERQATSVPHAGVGNARSEPEEATVSFVIRKEPARPVTGAGHGAAPSAPKQPAPPETPEPEPDAGTEAEVTIVTRRR